MTTYQTTTVPGRLWEYAPLDPKAVHELQRHASEVLSRAGIGPDRTPLGEAAAQIAIAICYLERVLVAEPDLRLGEGEELAWRLHRAADHVREHLAAEVPADELEDRNLGLIDSCLEEGLPVVGKLTAELLLKGGEKVTVTLTADDAHQTVHTPGSTARIPAAQHLIIRDGLHDLGRTLRPLVTGKGRRPLWRRWFTGKGDQR
ncbi:hypothetical protein [Kitasatospora sp. NPDC098663]|uniref:hypothetical protein n=1 Tax=Kitasatospora sp. NPDC098663 TaxID=3364096 RepID=UPI00382AE31A